MAAKRTSVLLVKHIWSRFDGHVSLEGTSTDAIASLTLAPHQAIHVPAISITSTLACIARDGAPRRCRIDI